MEILQNKTLQLILGSCISFMIIFYIIRLMKRKEIACKKYIKKEVLPMFEKLERLYGAECITVMYEIRGTIANISKSDSKTAYIFVANEAFHIVSSYRPEFHIILPFSEIEGHICYFRGNYYDSGDYVFQIRPKSEKYSLVFETIPHDLYSKDKRFSGQELYEFVTSNFPQVSPYYC